MPNDELTTKDLAYGMTLAHDVSASGGLRVSFGQSEVPVQAQALLNTRQNFPTQHLDTQISESPYRLTHQSTLLATALLQINSSSGTHRARALIDPGSELTFVSENLVISLKLQRVHSVISISGIGGNNSIRTRGIIYCTLQSIYSPETINIRAHVLKTLTTVLPSAQVQIQEWPHIKKLQLADPNFRTPQNVDIILGADCYGQVIKPNIIYNSPDTPIAQLSIFGWLVLGPVTQKPFSRECKTFHTTLTKDDSTIQELLTKFWIQEEVPIITTTLRSPENQECEDHFRRTHRRHSSGRYIVRIPLKSPATTLGDSYKIAYRSLQRQLRRLSKDQNYNRLYTQFMQEYEQLGHMVKAKPNNQHGIEYFLPHHGVLRPSSTTTKLRVVFNGSSPTSTGYSLNDITHTGEKIQLDITDVLLWIRKHKYLFATDITKMYRQIMVHEDDWHLQQVLWVDSQQKIIPYQLTTVTYGTRSAPYLAVRVLLQLVQDEGHNYPAASEAITLGRYVDDIFGGADTTEELDIVAKELINLCKAGGFPLAKWYSNNTPLLESIFNTATQSKLISFDDCATKILGLNWNSSTDTLNFSSRHSKSGSTITKRLILSEVAQIFDPLGFVSPTTVRAKMLLQELWLHKLSWDDPAPHSLAKRWLIIREDLSNLDSVSIPRWINTHKHSTCELHGFSDASQLAMAAAIYIKVYSPSNGPTTTLLCAKTKVAPLKKLTIPRLELTAALILAKLIKYVQATLHVNIDSTFLWTDSSVTLAWINANAAKWKEFVRNRVLQIQHLVPNAHWRHIPGKENPADCASRGMDTSQLINNTLWWSGPTWLSKSKEHWPMNKLDHDEACELEARPGLSFVATTLQQPTQWDLLERYSTFNKLLRITAILFKAISRFKGIPDPAQLLTPADLEKARKFCIKSTQAAYFKQEIKLLSANSKLPPTHVFNKLTAFIDSEGIVRVGGRLQHSQLDPEGKHPAILPKISTITTLVIRDAHLKTLHGGVQLTLSTLRQQYWILGGRYPVKSLILRCIQCARQRGVRAQQLMGQLPRARVTPSRPFLNTGVDYAGPLSIKTWHGRGAKIKKAWICVFVCMVSSAVHLELVSDYSTDGFIATFRRFISRRGNCHTLFSDCGKNFIGANAEIKRLFYSCTQEHQIITKFLTDHGTHWSFNPPAAPHMGGKWESVVKSVKYHLNRTIKDISMTFEELSTLLTQIEALLNSRPLEPLSDDPDDPTALTPGHFLIGDALTALPEPSLLDIRTSRLNKWQLIQQRTQQFWARWSKSYLQHQHSISKWFHQRNDIKPGSLVLIIDERFPPAKWPLARVITLHPGPDGLSRVATIRTSTTTLTRPIAKLAVLPVITSEDIQHQSNDSTQSDDTPGANPQQDKEG